MNSLIFVSEIESFMVLRRYSSARLSYIVYCKLICEMFSCMVLHPRSLKIGPTLHIHLGLIFFIHSRFLTLIRRVFNSRSLLFEEVIPFSIRKRESSTSFYTKGATVEIEILTDVQRNFQKSKRREYRGPVSDV